MHFLSEGQLFYFIGVGRQMAEVRRWADATTRLAEPSQFPSSIPERPVVIVGEHHSFWSRMKLIFSSVLYNVRAG